VTTSQPQYSYPAAAAVSGWLSDADDEQKNAGVPVCAGDAEADRLRAGAGDASLEDVPRDGDGVPVGRDDADADARRAAGEDPGGS
jgi:hypothetical protein